MQSLIRTFLPLVCLILVFSACQASSRSPFPNLKIKYDGTYPTQHFDLHLVDVHFTSGNLSDQYVAHHYCYFLNVDFLECLLMNGTNEDAKIKGTEWFITPKLFEQLDMEERKVWHSHPYEIQSGMFAIPEATDEQELQLLEWLITTYGKVTDVWQNGRDLPGGVPQLGLALAMDSQVQWELVDEMDKSLKLRHTWKERRDMYKNIPTPPKIEGADDYLKSGLAAQYKIYFFKPDSITHPPGKHATKDDL